MTQGLSAVTPPARRRRAGFVVRALRHWRLWVPALVLGGVAVAAAQGIEHHLFMDLPMGAYHALSGVLQAVIVAVPVVLYIFWRRAADREREALGKLQTSEALRDDMTHMLVHDLKGPLTAAMAGLRLVTDRRNDALDETDRQTLSIALCGQDRLAGMIETILDVAQAEAGKLPLSPSTCDLSALAREAVDEALPAATEAGLELTIDTPDQAPAHVDCDKIRRVIDNLLSNALKYTRSGETIHVSVERDGDTTVITVRDAGPGVPEHLRERIFDKFAQAEAARDGHKMSVGLGLTFCKLMVEAHGGQIWVEDAPGGGSVFAFALPTAEGEGGSQ